jgi:NADH dehydrogenase [ubiquinone] 1 alpha subcomplex assembly factor 5
MIPVFDRAQIRRQRQRCLRHLPSHDFLFQWTMGEISERLRIIKKKFPLCLQIGARAPLLPPEQYGIAQTFVSDCMLVPCKCFVQSEEDFLPYANGSIDLIVSALNLHTVNDLPGSLIQIRQILKPDGLFLAGMLGGETLNELRTCLAQAEMEITGGISPRIAPFTDKQQMGALLQRAGFALPVVDSEKLTVTYDSIFPMMHDLRLMGEGNAIAAREKKFTRREIFFRTEEIYADKFPDREENRIYATFEIIFLLGWAPHESQQKPLPRGSAKASLADFLEKRET